MMFLAMGVDRRRVFHTQFLTMTVRAGTLDGWSEDGWDRCENARRLWAAAWVREYGEAFVMMWRKELTKKGTLHLHGLLLWLENPPPADELRAFNDHAWAEAAGAVGAYADERVCCQLVRVRDWRGVSSYASKYLSKPDGFQFNFRTGRVWGVVNRRLFPVTQVLSECDGQVGVIARRCCRRLLERRRRRWQFRTGPGLPWLSCCSLSLDDGSVSGIRDEAGAVQACRRFGWQVRLSRVRVTHKALVPVWAVETDLQTGRSETVRAESEPVDYVSSVFFLDDETFARVMSWSMAEASSRAVFDRGVP